MNKLLIPFLLAFSSIASGQSVDAYVISSTGDALMNENGAVYFTVGEPFNTEISDGNIMISQGFLQITLQEGTTSSQELLENSFSVYPNPTHNLVNIERTIDNVKNFTVFLLNSTGQKLGSTLVESSITKVDLSTLDSGMYFLQIHSEKDWIGTYQIVKQ